jgi:hypothetical protein
MKLYIVTNLEDAENPYVINICSNLETAEKLVEQYKNNYELGGYRVPEFSIDEADTDNDIIYDVYEYHDSNNS